MRSAVALAAEASGAAESAVFMSRRAAEQPSTQCEKPLTRGLSECRVVTNCAQAALTKELQELVAVALRQPDGRFEGICGFLQLALPR